MQVRVLTQAHCVSNFTLAAGVQSYPIQAPGYLADLGVCCGDTRLVHPREVTLLSREPLFD